jgi:quercetin dioxygenase-like cupin family protein
MKISAAGTVASRLGSNAWFTGTVWVNEIQPITQFSHLHALRVWFAPSSRTAWHTHPRGQTLHVLDGLGIVQTAGQSPQLIRPGDTVFIDPGERHWHGAASGSTMTHLALQEADQDGNEVVWLELVTDADYQQSAT